MKKSLVLLAALLLSQGAAAQTLTQRPVTQEPVSPGEMSERLERSAFNTAKVAPKGAARGSSIDFCWPSSADEYRALAKHVIVLVSVVSQDAAELPLKRVYVTIDGRETELVKLSSQRSDVRKDSKTYSVLGPYREDGFYLAPAGVMMADGYLQADFAVKRTGFNLYKLPGTAPSFIKADGNPMPAPGARPETAALKAILQREYKGFELPASLR